MFLPLTDAPVGRPLLLMKVADPALALRLRRMGLFEGSEIIRLDQEILVQPVRIRGPEGEEAVLCGGMAMQVVVHLEDGRRLPLAEMERGERGHIEGLTGGTRLAAALEVLGLRTDDRIECVRKLPAMEYVAVIQGGGRVRLTEGMAARIWGRMRNRLRQFTSARVGEPFAVRAILGGGRSQAMLQARDIRPGTVLLLEGVAQAQSLRDGFPNPVVVASREGLRLFLETRDAARIFVAESMTH